MEARGERYGPGIQGCVEGPEEYKTAADSVVEQLVLKLGMPWHGISPRYLTRGSRLISFVRKGTGRTVQDEIRDAQLELFPEGTPYGS